MISIFFTLVFCLAIITTVAEIWSKGLKGAFHEKLENSSGGSLLYSAITQRKTYTLIDLLFDLWYFICYLKKNLFLCVLLFPLFAVLFFFFCILSPLYGFLFVLRLLYDWCFVIIQILLKKEKTIRLKEIQVGYSDSLFKYLTDLCKIPFAWADIAFYEILSLKRKKISFAVTQQLLIGFIFNVPFWVLSLIFKWVWNIQSICSQEFWRRKKKRAWFFIFLREFRKALFMDLYHVSHEISSLSHERKIFIKNRKISLNPNAAFFRTVVFKILSEEGNLLMSPRLIKVGGVYHQSFVNVKSWNNGTGQYKWCCVGTSGKSISLKTPKTVHVVDEQKLKTTFIGKKPIVPLAKKSTDRHIIFSLVDTENVPHAPGFTESFYKSNKLTSFESRMGLLLKIQMSFLFQSQDNIVYQSVDRSGIFFPIPKVSYADCNVLLPSVFEQMKAHDKMQWDADPERIYMAKDYIFNKIDSYKKGFAESAITAEDLLSVLGSDNAAVYQAARFHCPDEMNDFVKMVKEVEDRYIDGFTAP